MSYRGCACTLNGAWLAWIVVDALLWLLAFVAWGMHVTSTIRVHLAARGPGEE